MGGAWKNIEATHRPTFVGGEELTTREEVSSYGRPSMWRDETLA